VSDLSNIRHDKAQIKALQAKVDELKEHYSLQVAVIGGRDNYIQSLEAEVKQLKGKIKKAGDILAEHQTRISPTYLFNAITALKQEGGIT